ncbi:MAG TPA: cyclic nucleotide-binding and patatin-like phospholipase domain-containing protein [Roseiflexaceae bacterium]|nr:cyclic nucleotide-binding and patatin-like phospholipase domain-containing protein [Roseiflexaceae bacterium]
MAIVPQVLRAQLAGILNNLFGPLDPAVLHGLQSELEWIHLFAGTPLFKQGDPGDSLYIVVSGRLRVAQANATGGERAINEIGRGECVGEFALLTQEPRSATIYAIRDSNVVRLSQSLFDRLIRQHPQAMTQIARFIVRRVRAGERGNPAEGRPAPGAGPSAFAVIPAGDVPLDEFTRRAAEALSALGPTICLSSADCDRALDQPGVAQSDDDQPANAALIGWLSEQEARYRYIVYQADRDWSPWTRRCLRQADRVLILGQAGADPTPGSIEAALLKAANPPRAELVLLHPDSTPRPSGTSQWIERRRAHTYHHLRMDVAADFARLARRLGGRALGVVLSGGGARGYAHIGAIRALEEAGLHADFVGGTSIGALIGANYAAGRGHEEMLAMAAAFSSRRSLLDFTLPITSFNATRKLTNLYRALFDDIQIEDLWQRFFCISSNLTRAEPVIHEHGPLWSAVRASTAIPVIFAPLLAANGDVLIDGGILNNFPIDVMRARCETGVVIGVDVAPPTDKVGDYQFGASVSGWQLLWHRLNPFGRQVRAPTLFDSLVRTIEINSAYRVRSPAFRQHADLLIHMPDRQYGRLEFGIYGEMIEMGYQETKRQLQEWGGVPSDKLTR